MSTLEEPCPIRTHDTEPGGGMAEPDTRLGVSKGNRSSGSYAWPKANLS